MVKELGMATLAGFTVVLGYFYISRPGEPSVELKPLLQGAFVSGQIRLTDVPTFRRYDISTVIDLRPDGESADQPSSASVGAACSKAGLKFAYVPVQHGAISDKAVHDLTQVLEENPGGTLLYCRSGKRAVRTYCLAEASRSGGVSLQEILATAKSAGQSADDLTGDLEKRIAHRTARREAGSKP